VAYIRDGDRIVVVASNEGEPSNPDWYFNLLANPQVTVELGTRQIQAQATVAAEPQRTRLYGEMVKVMPGLAAYPGKTTRVIPVVVFSPDKSVNDIVCLSRLGQGHLLIMTSCLQFAANGRLACTPCTLCTPAKDSHKTITPWSIAQPELS
jgi:deazaflavin-dependent oxidoreductase (nitroreductase family)